MSAASSQAGKAAPLRTELSGPHFLDGQFLVAMPGMADERFARSVIYICAHSADGAMGIIVNKAATDISMPDLLVQLDVAPEADAIRLRERVGHMPVLMGGPVEGRRGFVLHSDDFHIQQSTLIIDDGICLTATVEILRAIASGEGRPAPCWRSATPAGRRGSWRARSWPTAGSTARPTRP